MGRDCLQKKMSLIEIISWPFAKLLWLFNFTGSYAVALLFFAIVVKLVTLPLSIKQQKTQIKGAKLRPKMALIEKKYAGRTDRKTLEKKQQELMELQREEGYSPLSGCLPLLIQLPIIIILYNIIQDPLTHLCGLDATQLETVRASLEAVGIEAAAVANHPSGLTLLSGVQSLGEGAFAAIPGISPDLITSMQNINLSLFGLNLGVVPTVSWSWYLLIPILTALSSYGSMKISRLLMGQTALQQTTSPETRTSGIIMDLMMPLMSLYFAFRLPALLGIYWIYQSVLGVAQQWILSRALPLPKYTEEEIRTILKAEKERANANRAAMRQNNYDARSLHHIDDDDDEDIVVPTIRSRFDDDDEDTAPKAAPAPAPAKKPAASNHKRQQKKKK